MRFGPVRRFIFLVLQVDVFLAGRHEVLLLLLHTLYVFNRLVRCLLNPLVSFFNLFLKLQLQRTKAFLALAQLGFQLLDLLPQSVLGITEHLDVGFPLVQGLVESLDQVSGLH